MTALAALMLVDCGELDVFAPVAKYWPEFAANGKSEIEVRHILSHTSGVSGWEQPFGLEDMYDWEGSITRLAAQAPWWTPGTSAGYHALNYGHLIGEIIRRITGLRLEEFVAKEVAEPLGADFQIGAREADWDRIAEIIAPPPLEGDLGALDPGSVMVKTLTGPTADARAANTAGCTDKTIDLIFTEQNNDADLVLGVPFRRGIGFALPHLDTMPSIPKGRICFWGGWGGSMTVMDLDRRMTFTYMMNKMGPGIIGSTRSEAYLRATYDALDGEVSV